MSLRTIGSLIGATNGAKDLLGMAANFFVNLREHANGIDGVTVPNEPFVVVPFAVVGTAEVPRLTFAIVWTERTTWQVTDYLSPDDDSFSEAWGSDNSCGYHIESKESQREKRVTITAEHLLMPNDKQVEMMRRWKSDDDAKSKECVRNSRIEELQKQIATLQADGNSQRAAQAAQGGE